MASRKAADPTRVLAIVLTSRYTGHAALDRWGLLGNGLGVFEVRSRVSTQARRETLLRLMEDEIERHEPAAIIFGIPRLEEPSTRTLRKSIVAHLRAKGHEVKVRPVTDTRRLFLGRLRARRPSSPR